MNLGAYEIHTNKPIDRNAFRHAAIRGTVTKVARDNGRSSIGTELSAQYIEIAKKWLEIHQTELDTGITVATYQFEEVVS